MTKQASPPLMVAVGQPSNMRLRFRFRNRIDAWVFRFVLAVVALICFEWLFHIVAPEELLVQVVILIVLGAAGLYRYAKGVHGE